MRCVSCLLCVAVAAVSFGNVRAEETPASADRPVPSDLPRNYRFKLVWSDEFDGTELDRRKWDYRRALCGKPWLSWTDKGVRLDGRGHCVFTVVEGTNGLPVSSQLQTGYNFMDTPVERTKFHEDDLQWNIGKLHRNKFLHRYGYWECRCRLQQRPGWWPAFWIQSPTIGASADPAETGAEIDVMESFRVGEIVPHNAYTAGYGKDANCEDTGFFTTLDPSVYHTFGVLWTEKGYTFYIDGREDGHINRNISRRPQFVLVGTEVDGYRRSCRQPTEAAKKAVGDTFVVDHVRVFDIVPEDDLALPEGVVVLSNAPDAPERFAAEEFAKWSEQLTGKPRELVFRRLSADERIVKDDGFRLDVEGNRAVVSAKHSFGFVAGVHYILSRFGGIRWFTPDSGADVPAGATELKVPRGTLVRNPLRFRAGLTPSSGKAATASVRRDVDLWHVRNGFRAVDTALSGESRPIRASYFKEAEVKAGADAGRRQLDEFRAWKAKNCPDSPATWSLFAIDVPSAEAWWDFVNPLAKEALVDPLVHVRVAVLRKCQAWPERESSWPVRDKRLSILFYTHGRCHLHDLDDPLCPHNALIRDRLLKWRRSGLEVNTFEFMNQLAGKCNYAFWERAWVRDLKWYAQQRIANSDGGLVGSWAGMSGKDDTYARNNSAKARWLTAYLAGWFSWDTQDDFEVVRADALRRYYRAAAEPMTRYHDLLENAMLDSGACLTYGGGTAFVAAALVPGVLDKAKALLAEARLRVGDDAELGRRLARDEEYFRVEWLEAVPEPTAAEKRALPATVAFGDSTVAVRREGEDLVVEASMTTPRDGYKDLPDDGSAFAAMKGTHAEFQLFAPTLKGRYWHFAVSHNGLVYSALSENGQSRDLTRRLRFSPTRSETPSGWTVACRIPLAELGERPRYVRLDVFDGVRTLSGNGFHQPLSAPVFDLTR